jgi:hypothetical protein
MFLIGGFKIAAVRRRKALKKVLIRGLSIGRLREVHLLRLDGFHYLFLYYASD